MDLSEHDDDERGGEQDGVTWYGADGYAHIYGCRDNRWCSGPDGMLCCDCPCHNSAVSFFD